MVLRNYSHVFSRRRWPQGSSTLRLVIAMLVFSTYRETITVDFAMDQESYDRLDDLRQSDHRGETLSQVLRWYDIPWWPVLLGRFSVLYGPHEPPHNGQIFDIGITVSLVEWQVPAQLYTQSTSALLIPPSCYLASVDACLMGRLRDRRIETGVGVVFMLKVSNYHLFLSKSSYSWRS